MNNKDTRRPEGAFVVCKNCSSKFKVKPYQDTYCDRCLMMRIEDLHTFDPSRFNACVYGLYDKIGKLLYIGVTGNPVQRVHSHIISKKFSTMRIIRCFVDRDRANHYEKFCIDKIRPVLNVLIDDRYEVLNPEWNATLSAFGEKATARKPKKKRMSRTKPRSRLCAICGKPVGSDQISIRGRVVHKTDCAKPVKAKSKNAVRKQRYRCPLCNKEVAKGMNPVRDSQGRVGYVHPRCYNKRLKELGLDK